MANDSRVYNTTGGTKVTPGGPEVVRFGEPPLSKTLPPVRFPASNEIPPPPVEEVPMSNVPLTGVLPMDRTFKSPNVKVYPSNPGVLDVGVPYGDDFPSQEELDLLKYDMNIGTKPIKGTP
jgi:hypothetical protein